MAKDLSGKHVGLAPEKGVNNPRPSNMRGRNIFPQSYQFLTTDRYGEMNPFFWAKCERGDVQNLATEHDLHTFTLKSPMVSNVTMTKSFVKVPMQAIYPRNWEKMFTIPTQGDDVPADTRALLDVRSLVVELVDLYNSTGSPEIKIKCFILLEYICSHGSLFERFNAHFSYTFLYNDHYVSIDKISNDFWYGVMEAGLRGWISVGEMNYKIRPDDSDPQPNTLLSYVTRHAFVELLRNFDFRFSSSAQEYLENVIVWPSFEFYDGYDSTPYNDLDPYENFLNIEPLISYQLACAQFLTNDHVDFIYSAQLFRDNMQSLYSAVHGESVFPTFIYNGVSYQYDVFSLHVFNNMISGLSDNFSDSADFWYNLFSYRKSLRYGDYFIGGRPQPLAVGEYSAPVVNNEVSAIDVTRSIQMQRLLNRVNMVGRKLGDYLSGIFGGSLPEAPKDVPIFLALQEFSIDGFETNNTGDAQRDALSVTSHLRSSVSKHVYEVQIDEPCYIIGMNSYESLRVYSKTLDRFYFHHDRYDDFIPEMQYIGDQEIYLNELQSDKRTNERTAFAYALRYMEYKQRYSYASGGFIENLPSWSFITDNSDGFGAFVHIDPYYIRSSSSEFDRFYSSLTDFSLAGHFHFIVSHVNKTAPVRQMEYAPEILK